MRTYFYSAKITGIFGAEFNVSEVIEIEDDTLTHKEVLSHVENICFEWLGERREVSKVFVHSFNLLI